MGNLLRNAAFGRHRVRSSSRDQESHFFLREFLCLVLWISWSGFKSLPRKSRKEACRSPHVSMGLIRSVSSKSPAHVQVSAFRAYFVDFGFVSVFSWSEFRPSPRKSRNKVTKSAKNSPNVTRTPRIALKKPFNTKDDPVIPFSSQRVHIRREVSSFSAPKHSR